MKRFDKYKAKYLFKQMKKRAENLLRNPSKTKDVIDAAEEKSKDHTGPLTNVWNELHIMFNLVRDWIKGNYKQAPSGSIIAILGAILYFLSPIDAIPDFIPVAGFLDDVYVLKLVINQVRADLNAYKVWLNDIEE